MDPGIITINKNGYCRDCEFMELEIDNVYSDNKLIAQNIDCPNRQICDRIFHITVMDLTARASEVGSQTKINAGINGPFDD